MALAGQHRDIQMKLALERDVRLVRFEQGQIEFSLSSGASPQLAQTLARRLQEWTGTRWMVAVSNAPGAPSLKEQEDAKTSRSSVGCARRAFGAKRARRVPGCRNRRGPPRWAGAGRKSSGCGECRDK